VTTELVLLLIMSFFIITPFTAGLGRTFKEEGIPKLAVKMEKHIVTGYLFSQRAEGTRDNRNQRIEWRGP